MHGAPAGDADPGGEVVLDILNISFPVSGVETNILVPPLVGLVVSFFGSMGGISGAFLLLPFQMSFLGYSAPSVSGTNHVYNVVAIPSGVYRYVREGRMAWPLVWVIIAGTLPGVFVGFLLRVSYLAEPGSFKAFVGCVLLYLGVRLLRDFSRKPPAGGAAARQAKSWMGAPRRPGRAASALLPPDAVVTTVSVSSRRIEYEFWGERFSFSPLVMFVLSLAVGIIGGAYGIGGGAIIAPVLISLFGLPVHTIAGAALMGTLVTSSVGALVFSLFHDVGGVAALPDWPLGILFGAGGFVGMYLGARAQKYVPQRWIKLMLCAIVLLVGVSYVVQFF